MRSSLSLSVLFIFQRFAYCESATLDNGLLCGLEVTSFNNPVLCAGMLPSQGCPYGYTSISLYNGTGYTCAKVFVAFIERLIENRMDHRRCVLQALFVDLPLKLTNPKP